MAVTVLHSATLPANGIKLAATTALDEISTRAQGLAALIDMAMGADDLDPESRAALAHIADQVRDMHKFAFNQARAIDGN